MVCQGELRYCAVGGEGTKMSNETVDLIFNIIQAIILYGGAFAFWYLMKLVGGD